ncbi:MAG: type II toxin-antitoxin system VapB family antitoxin [Deltaproteobacteria bacterium]|nr:type II toxin-antitoxin system VapB family antitoxin [Deltaproteobacteria bacterium]
MAKTLVDIKEPLLRKAQRITGMTKKVDVVNYALEQVIRQKELERFLRFQGKIHWRGDLARMRKNRRDFS